MIEGLPRDLRRYLRQWWHIIDGLMYLAACCPSFDPIPDALRHRADHYCGKHGYLELLQYICSVAPVKKHENIYIEAEVYAARHGRVNILDWLKDKPHRRPYNLCERAAMGNQMEALKWIFNFENFDYFLTGRCVYSAAGHGNLEMLTWLYEKGCTQGRIATLAAIGKGHFNVLKWLYARQAFSMKVELCAEAACAGQLDVLVWLREIGCPWDEDVTYFAAARNHLHVLHWAVSNGCPISPSVFYEVARHDHVDILKWGYASGYDIGVGNIARLGSRFLPKVGAWLESLK
jgi:hypothetical protein